MLIITPHKQYILYIFVHIIICTYITNFSIRPYISRERQRQVRKWQQQQKSRQNYNRPAQIKQRESSVTVRPDWIVIEEMEKTQLSKLALPTVSEPEDL